MKRYLVTNIEWDCDDESDFEALPQRMIVEDENDLNNDNYELSDFISDTITDIIGYCHRGCDYKEIKPLSREDIIDLVSKMKSGDILDIYGVENENMPDLAMGVEKHCVLDGLDVFLCNVYGSSCDFQSFPLEDCDLDTTEEIYKKVADYFFQKASAMCGSSLQFLSSFRIYE